MATILVENDMWVIPPRSAKENAFRVVRRAENRWAVQATTAERYEAGGEWFSPFVSALNAEDACVGLVRRMATQVKDKAYLDEVAREITRLTGAPPPPARVP